jgi:UDP-N-acetylmuramoyl-tripeptide--D-alanyl-D-alanine ligase
MGLHAAQMGIDHVLCLGDLAAHTATACGANAQHMSDIDALNQHVMHLLPQLGSVLVKGSRFMKMERVIDVISACHDHHTKETTPCC